MKKKILIFNIVVAVFFGGYIFLQRPLMNSKLSTEAAINGIERELVKTDLTPNEYDRLDFFKLWVVGNQKRSERCNENAGVAGVFVCLIFIVNNVVILLFGKEKQLYDNGVNRSSSVDSGA
ncbi:hypothetical protein P3T73_13030 [Kiritimatiellota bacterium B12222]|nr:hypothetical protein P3T73_13030 [Kiritimatiellota bacterium B12222]